MVNPPPENSSSLPRHPGCHHENLQRLYKASGQQRTQTTSLGHIDTTMVRKPYGKWIPRGSQEHDGHHVKNAGTRNALPDQYDRNEKAPEMFNHFRGFVLFNNGGEIGIRTLGTGEGTTDFESVPFGHSGISPTARIITTLSQEANPLSEIFLCYQMLASVKAVRPGDWRLLHRLR